MVITRLLARGLTRKFTARGGVGGEELNFYFSNIEARQLVAAMTVQPDDARKRLIDNLVSGLKTDGIWDRLDAFWVLAAHDSQAGRLNWKTPGTFTLTESGTGTWTTDRGWAGNGTNGKLDSGLAANACVLATQNSNAAFVWSRTVTSISASFAAMGAGAQLLVVPRNGSDLFNYRGHQATSTATASTDGSGLFAYSRTGAGATQGYKNGAANGSAGAVASAAPTANSLGFGQAISTFNSGQAAAGGVGASLDATQHANLYTRLNTYLTAIGAV